MLSLALQAQISHISLQFYCVGEDKWQSLNTIYECLPNYKCLRNSFHWVHILLPLKMFQW